MYKKNIVSFLILTSSILFMIFFYLSNINQNFKANKESVVFIFEIVLLLLIFVDILFNKFTIHILMINHFFTNIVILLIILDIFHLINSNKVINIIDLIYFLINLDIYYIVLIFLTVKYILRYVDYYFNLEKILYIIYALILILILVLSSFFGLNIINLINSFDDFQIVKNVLLFNMKQILLNNVYLRIFHTLSEDKMNYYPYLIIIFYSMFSLSLFHMIFFVVNFYDFIKMLDNLVMILIFIPSLLSITILSIILIILPIFIIIWSNNKKQKSQSLSLEEANNMFKKSDDELKLSKLNQTIITSPTSIPSQMTSMSESMESPKLKLEVIPESQETKLGLSKSQNPLPNIKTNNYNSDNESDTSSSNNVFEEVRTVLVKKEPNENL
jgi:hypothetical protein